MRKNIVNLFESRTFPYKGNVFKIKEEESKEESKEESNEERAKKMPEYIENETKDINIDLFNKYFNFAVPSALAKYFYETKDKKKNNKLVNVTNTGLNDLKNEIKKKF